MFAQTADTILAGQVQGFGLAFLIITCVMCVALRSPLLGLLSLVPNLVPIAAMLGAMGYLGIPFNSFNSMIASIARWGLIFGMGGRDDRDQNPIALLVMAIVAPIAAMIVQLAISRQNEFQADATAARITGDPNGLASALQRIEAYASRIPMAVNLAAAQLAIINPLRGGQASAIAGLFRTHPPTEERVARLLAR